jgi:hypothetical protein
MAMRLSQKRSDTSALQTSAPSQTYARPFVVPTQMQEEAMQAAPEQGVSLLNNRYQVSATPKYQPGWIARAQGASQPKGLGVQAKLTIGQSNDKYEQEADRVAEQVMGMPDAKPAVQREGLPGEEEELQTKSLGGAIQREVMPEEEEEIQAKCEKCDEEPIQRSAEGSVQTQPDLESRLMASKGSGSPLSADVRSFMEPRFGADFSGVRVHTGGEAVQMNREVGAQAFAHGQDVYFGAGKGPGKDELTAHELTHVVQQTGLAQGKLISKKSAIQLKCSACEQEEEEGQRSLNTSIQLKPVKGVTSPISQQGGLSFLRNAELRLQRTDLATPPSPYNNLKKPLLEMLDGSYNEHTAENNYLANAFWGFDPKNPTDRPPSLWAALDRIEPAAINAFSEVYETAMEIPGLWEHIKRTKQVWVTSSRGFNFEPTFGEDKVREFVKNSPNFCEDLEPVALAEHKQYCWRQLDKTSVPGIHVCLGRGYMPDIHVDMHQVTTKGKFLGRCSYNINSVIEHNKDLNDDPHGDRAFFNRAKSEAEEHEKEMHKLRLKTQQPYPCSNDEYQMLNITYDAVQTKISQFKANLRNYATQSYRGELRGETDLEDIKRHVKMAERLFKLGCEEKCGAVDNELSLLEHTNMLAPSVANNTSFKAATSPIKTGQFVGLKLNDGLHYGTWERRPRIQSLQARLNLYGYSCKVDGMFGSKTLAALKQFQSSRNLLESDVIDQLTSNALESDGKKESDDNVPVCPRGKAPFTVAALRNSDPIDLLHNLGLA